MRRLRLFGVGLGRGVCGGSAGAIALNRAVGGINPLAVEIAAREGARTVWMPTVDAVNEAQEREAPPGAKVPVWVKLQLELRQQGIEIPPVPVVDEVDLAKGHVSWISPIAKALLKAEEGDVVKMRTPNGVEELVL